MKVFSACLKIMKYHKSTFLTYLIIFTTMLLFVTKMIGETGTYTTFTKEKPEYAIINRDKDNTLTEGIMAVLEMQGTPVELEDSKEAMMDAGFYEAAEGIFIIPEGFTESFWKGEDKEIEIWKRPSSASGYYLESAVEEFLNSVCMYRELGSNMSEEQMTEAALSSMSKECETQMRQYMSGSVVSGKIRIYLRFLPYILLLTCISCVGIVFMAFQRPEIRMRNLCSPANPSHIALQKFLYVCVIGVADWILLNIVGTLFCLNEWRSLDFRFILLLFGNSFIMAVVAVSVALLCSSFMRGQNAQSFVPNIVSLGMCFLSGVFVPQELLSEKILHVSKFIPVYWYARNVDRICDLTGFTVDQLHDIYVGIGIQLGFAAAMFCIYLAVNKFREREAQDFGSAKTEIEM